MLRHRDGANEFLNLARVRLERRILFLRVVSGTRQAGTCRRCERVRVQDFPERGPRWKACGLPSQLPRRRFAKNARIRNTGETRQNNCGNYSHRKSLSLRSPSRPRTSPHRSPRPPRLFPRRPNQRTASAPKWLRNLRRNQHLFGGGAGCSPEASLVNFGFGPLCGLTSDISRRPRGANCDQEVCDVRSSPNCCREASAGIG
jgi:hypothetical protein